MEVRSLRHTEVPLAGFHKLKSKAIGITEKGCLCSKIMIVLVSHLKLVGNHSTTGIGVRLEHLICFSVTYSSSGEFRLYSAGLFNNILDMPEEGVFAVWD
jgi:hypothetical protein